MTTRSQLAVALRRNFSSPRAVLRKLGIDENVLSEPPPPRHDENGGDKMMAMRHAIERLLSEQNLPDEKMAAVVDLLNEYAPEGRDESPDDELDIEALRTFLKKHGMADDDIKAACDVVAGLPRNAIEGGLRGGQLASDAALRRFSKKYPDAMRVEAGPRRERPSTHARRLALDTATAAVAGNASLERKYGQDFARIKIG